MGKSLIPYCTHTWNPIEGCQACSPACRHCWAKRYVRRAAQNPAFRQDHPWAADAEGPMPWNPYRNLVKWDGTLVEFPHRWPEPVRAQKPARWFVGSRSDIALWPEHDIRTIQVICQVEQQHRFLLLTKRPAMLAEKVPEIVWGENVWLGVTVWDQESADELIPALFRIPAAHYWVSYEPAIGPVDFRTTGAFGREDCRLRVSWLVLGGESGPREVYECPECGRTPKHDGFGCCYHCGRDLRVVTGTTRLKPEWVRSVRDQCQAAGVRLWFKQWGDGPWGETLPDFNDIQNARNHKATLDGEVIEQMPEGLWLPGERRRAVT